MDQNQGQQGQGPPDPQDQQAQPLSVSASQHSNTNGQPKECPDCEERKVLTGKNEDGDRVCANCHNRAKSRTKIQEEGWKYLSWWDEEKLCPNNPQKGRRRGRLLFWISVVAPIYLILTVLVIGLSMVPYMFLEDGTDFIFQNNTTSLLLLILATLGAYTAFSFDIIKEDELGVRLLFGKPINNLDSGLVFVPWMVCNVVRFTKNRIQMGLPSDEDVRGKYVQSVVDEETGKQTEETEVVIRLTTASAQAAKFTPIKPVKFMKEKDRKRIVEQNRKEEEEFEEALVDFGKRKTRTRTTESREDLLHERLTVEPRFIVRFKIVNPMRFIQVIGREEAAAKTQIADTVVARAQAEFGRMTPALILRFKDRVDDLIHQAVESLIGEAPDPEKGYKRDPWGIELRDAYLSELGITFTVNKSVAERLAARFEREKKRLEGEGQGAHDRALLEGRAEGLAKIAKATSTEEGRLVLQYETLRDTVGGENRSRLILTGSDLTSAIAGTLGVGKEIVDQTPSGSGSSSSGS